VTSTWRRIWHIKPIGVRITTERESPHLSLVKKVEESALLWGGAINELFNHLLVRGGKGGGDQRVKFNVDRGGKKGGESFHHGGLNGGKGLSLYRID